MTGEQHRELLEIIMNRRPGIPSYINFRVKGPAPIGKPALVPHEPPCPAHDSYPAAQDEFDAAAASLEEAQRRFNSASRRVRAIVDKAAGPLRKLLEARK